MTETSDRQQFNDALAMAADKLRIELSGEQIDHFWEHRRLVVDANERFNITRITEPADFAVKHVADALSVVAWQRAVNAVVSTVLDVGTGAGVPAIPIAIVRRDWRVTALDGSGKKSTFVAQAAASLGLTNVQAVNGRAETWGGESAYDLVLFKAVSSVERCVRFARRHVAMNGYVVVYQTEQSAPLEIIDAARTAARLGFDLPQQYAYALPMGDEIMSRVLLMYRRVRETVPSAAI